MQKNTISGTLDFKNLKPSARTRNYFKNTSAQNTILNTLLKTLYGSPGFYRSNTVTILVLGCGKKR